MRTQAVKTKLVLVTPGRHSILDRVGFNVTVLLNDNPMVSQFFTNEISARSRADTLERRKIPKNAELAFIGGRWLPLTSCNAIFK